jgi:hypothetical protein
MSKWEWEREYRALLEQGREQGEFLLLPNTAERRASPRFRLKMEHVWIKVEPKFSVVDVSVRGIALYSDFPFDPGQFVNITLGKAFSVEARIVGCRLVESDPDLLENKYLVRCEFDDETTGMRFLVMIKEMDNLRVEGQPADYAPVP